MSTTLGFSEIDYTKEQNNSYDVSSKKNSTRRRKEKKHRPSKARTFLNSMGSPGKKRNNNNNDDDKPGYGDDESKSGDGLADFVPNPVLTRVPEESRPNEEPGSDLLGSNKDTSVTPENFKLLQEGSANADYYKQFINPQTQNFQNQYAASSSWGAGGGMSAAAAASDPNELIKKLNYMIHLLEEQQDEKTDNVTEELILYLFLGVFVIFVVDSFARAGKYTR